MSSRLTIGGQIYLIECSTENGYICRGLHFRYLYNDIYQTFVVNENWIYLQLRIGGNTGDVIRTGRKIYDLYRIRTTHLLLSW